MAIIADVLYVADIDLVRKFDRRTGKPLGSVYIDNAQFLNDMATAPDGDVYVTDTGINPDFSPAGGDAIYTIQADDVVATYAKGKELGQNVVLRRGDVIVVP